MLIITVVVAIALAVWSKQFLNAAWVIGTFVAIIIAGLLWGAGHKEANKRQKNQFRIGKVLLIISFLSITAWAFCMSRGWLPWTIE